MDREEQAEISFVVWVYDVADSSLGDTATVTVSIQDLNDNPPDIIFPVSFSAKIC